MAEYPKIAAETRTEFGKGAARRIRRAHKIPAVLYGHGGETVHLSLPGHDTMLATKVANAVLDLTVDGKQGLALVKDVQRDPIKPIIEHVDLVTIRRGEKVIVEVGVVVVGSAAPETVVTLEQTTVQIEAEATHIPDGIEVDVEGREAGTQILAKDLVLPPRVTLVTAEEALVVNVTQAVTAEALDAELAEAEAAVGIEKDEPVDEAGAPVAEAAPAAEEA